MRQSENCPRVNRRSVPEGVKFLSNTMWGHFSEQPEKRPSNRLGTLFRTAGETSLKKDDTPGNCSESPERRKEDENKDCVCLSELRVSVAKVVRQVSGL